MSMPLASTPPTEPAAAAAVTPVEATPPATPATPATPVETPPAAEATGIHPSWQTALDEMALPDIFLPKLTEQIKRSEAAANKAIEEAKAAALPAEWSALYQDAQANGIDVNTLINSYNDAQSFYSDPLGFIKDFEVRVDEAVKAGKITREVGDAVKAENREEAAEALEELAATETPEMKAMREQLAKLTKAEEERSAAAAAADQAAAESKAADEYAKVFYGELDKQLGDRKAGLSDDQYAVLTKVADSMIADDTSGKITLGVGIQAAINQMDAIGALTPKRTPAIPAVPPVVPPVTGGGNLVETTPQGVRTDAQRKQAMMDAAAAALAE